MVASSGGHGSLIGATLGGYRVEALIGRGAMGSVYLARDVKLNRLVALKVLLGSLSRTPSMVKQFYQEAQASAPLRHPGIVRIYSTGIEEGTPYIAMEFVDGEPLDRFLARKGKVAWDVALHIGGQMAQALDCAHQSGVVHRDVKPSNIMLDRRGRVRLTDFGIASIQSEESGGGSDVVGTPQYMSPEQLTGGQVGPASDLFALGVTLYQMVSGEMPFRGESSMALVKSVCTDEPPRLNKLDPSIPDDVARLVAYLMEKDSEARPANAKVTSGLVQRLHKHGGGASVLTQSLNSFLKEEMEVRAFSSVQSQTADTKKKISKIQKRAVRPTPSFPWGRIIEGAVIALLAVAALAAGPVMGSFARETRAGLAPVIDMASFQRIRPGVQRSAVFADGYEINEMLWAGEQSLLLVQSTGVPGGLAQGASGLISIDPERSEILSLRTPTGPSSDPRFAARRSSLGFDLAVPKAADNASLAGKFLVQARRSGARPLVTLAQRLDASAPNPQVLFAATEREWFGSDDPQWQDAPPSRAVLSPNGQTICLLLRDESTGYSYIVERDIADKPLHKTGERRTTAGEEIIPRSVQYTRDGSKIVYLRRGSRGRSELWLLTASGIETNGHRLATGILGDTYALSPDGRRVAATMMQPDGRSSGLSIIDVRYGEIETTFAVDQISPQAWHASGLHLVFSAPRQTAGEKADPSPAATRDLYVAQTDAPYTVHKIESSGRGVTGEVAVSRDGRWIAAAENGAPAPTVLFWEWDAIQFDIGS